MGATLTKWELPNFADRWAGQISLSVDVRPAMGRDDFVIAQCYMDMTNYGPYDPPTKMSVNLWIPTGPNQLGYHGSLAFPDPAIQPHQVKFSPDGNWLAVGCDYTTDQAPSSLQRTRMFKADANGAGQNWTEVTSGQAIWGQDAPNSLSWDSTSSYLAVTSAYYDYDTYQLISSAGLVKVNGGNMVLTDAFPWPNETVTNTVAWHPSQPILAATGQQNTNEVRFFERDDDRLRDTGKVLPIDDYLVTGVAWNPAGTCFVINRYLQDGNHTCLAAYAWPSLASLGYLPDYSQVQGGQQWEFSPNGDMLAGGTVYKPDPQSSCGPGDLHGLVLTGIDLSGPQIGETLLAEPYLDANDPVMGGTLAWGTSDSATLLVTGNAYQDDSMWSVGYHDWGMTVYTVSAGSELSMCMPDGKFRLVGVAGQPLSLYLPDGSLRTWPGAGSPLYLRMPDGTWKMVIS